MLYLRKRYPSPAPEDKIDCVIYDPRDPKKVEADFISPTLIIPIAFIIVSFAIAAWWFWLYKISDS